MPVCVRKEQMNSWQYAIRDAQLHTPYTEMVECCDTQRLRTELLSIALKMSSISAVLRCSNAKQRDTYV
jgi:hypothetical protein